ncbi:MAG TPA: hypothetical protein DCQ98_03345 [Planctomycetaceae bacterium]|nr:hypothetical protein [Planctomycetaceae bacterium]HRF01885.1 hypothetical protein [Pirellulaceae bacterium]
MKSRRPSVILLPCHSLDDFPVYHKGDDAAGLLSGWTALWHPQLLAATGELPTWHRIDSPPAEVHDQLIVVPQVAYGNLATGFAARVQEAGGKLLRATGDRDTLIAAALEFVEPDRPLADDVVADFLALGYCYLQVQLLTRHMRYSSNLDLIHFGQQVVAAAHAALAEDGPTMRDRLQRCFDLLTEEREHYYPVDVRLIDLVVLPPFDSAERLSPQLDETHAVNLLAPAGNWQGWMNGPDGPKYREAFERGRWQAVGGEDAERRTPLLGPETLLAGLVRGRAEYERLIGVAPKVFGRRRFGLHWAYPQVLLRSGIVGALHATLDDGRFPEGLQLKTRWEGSDRGVIDAFARVPQDASLAETYLKFAIRIGEMLDSDHAAAMALVRWPGKPLPFFRDLLRVAHYCGALGRFVSFESFLREHRDPGITDRFLSDQYRSPYLQQAVIRGESDPLSNSTRYWSNAHQVAAISGLELLRETLEGRRDAATAIDVDRLQALTDDAEESADGSRSAAKTVAQSLDTAASRTAAAFGRSGKGRGWLVLNPTGSVRRTGIRLPLDAPLPAVTRPIYAADRAADGIDVVVDVPAMGYVWIPAEGKGSAPMSGPPLGEEFILRNEFFETTIDRASGGIRTYHHYDVRANRLSQQLAIRLGDGETPYTRMQADSIETLRLNRACGEIESRGRLVTLDDRTVGTFRQRFRILRGSRILEIEGEVTSDEPLKSDPWKSYVCQRLVWRDQAADCWRDSSQVRVAAGPKRVEAPGYFEIEFEPRRTTLLTGGLTFHRRPESHHLDSLLKVRGETTTEFRFGLALDVPHGSHLAQHFRTPPIVVADVPCPPQGSTGWLFHVDARNVLATRWQGLTDEQGRTVGYRVRLLETLGRPAKVRLASAREAVSGAKVDFVGDRREACETTDGKVLVEMVPNEFVEVEVRWQG